MERCLLQATLRSGDGFEPFLSINAGRSGSGGPSSHESFKFNLEPPTVGTFVDSDDAERRVFWTSFSSGTIDLAGPGVGNFVSYSGSRGWVRVEVTEYDQAAGIIAGTFEGDLVSMEVGPELPDVAADTMRVRAGAFRLLVDTFDSSQFSTTGPAAASAPNFDLGNVEN